MHLVKIYLFKYVLMQKYKDWGKFCDIFLSLDVETSLFGKGNFVVD